MSATTYSSIWIAIFTLLAGVYWPDVRGLAFIALAFIGLLHLAVLVYEQIASPAFYEKMSPEEFEHYCAAVLRQRKWHARVTPPGADQGVDIVADKRGLRIVRVTEQTADFLHFAEAHGLRPGALIQVVERDLAGFWKNSYAEVRKDLRGRYPKHRWPDDPANAEPMGPARPRR